VFGHKIKGAAGFIEVVSPDVPTQVYETRQCCHCGRHWLYRPGSGTRRGFCMQCTGLTCGDPKCDPCVPYEARIELEEGQAPGAAARRYLDDYLKLNTGA
jgi:hypothetical protein